MFIQILNLQLIAPKKWGLSIVLFIFFSCNQTEKSAQDVLRKTLEKTITERSGTKVDLGAIDDYSNTSAIVSFKAADKVFLKADEKLNQYYRLVTGAAHRHNRH